MFIIYYNGVSKIGLNLSLWCVYAYVRWAEVNVAREIVSR